MLYALCLHGLTCSSRRERAAKTSGVQGPTVRRPMPTHVLELGPDGQMPCLLQLEAGRGIQWGAHSARRQLSGTTMRGGSPHHRPVRMW